jgi:predicted nucleic acid-binding protein
LIPKIVIDTNIYISAIFWGGKPREVVDMGRDGAIIIFTSAEIEEEIVDKLRTKFRLNDQDLTFIISDCDIRLQMDARCYTSASLYPLNPSSNCRNVFGVYF